MQDEPKTPITPEELVADLADLAVQHRLIERAIASCDTCFKNEGGQIAGWTSEELQKQFFSHSLTFLRADWSMVYIDTRLDLFASIFASKGQQVGYYRLITTLDGRVDDDYLVFDLTKEEYQQIKE